MPSPDGSPPDAGWEVISWVLVLALPISLPAAA